MRKLLLGFALLSCFATEAQYNVDFGFKLGGANYLGEIGGNEKTGRNFILDMKLNRSATAAGGFVRYKFTPMVSGALSFTYGHIKGEDANSSNPGRVGRNLSFKNNILELALRGEVYLYNINDVGNRGRYRLDFKSYAFLGIAGFHHNPQARSDKYNGGAWTKLQPLQTEGVEYKNYALSIPGGIGFYMTQKRKHRLGWEIGWSTAFTDYIDDVSSVYPEYSEVDPLVYDAFTNRTDDVDPSLLPLGGADNYTPGSKRGGADKNDAYVFTTFNYSYVIKGRNSFYRQNYSWLSGRGGKRRTVRAKF